jgi:hypothetical protein
MVVGDRATVVRGTLALFALEGGDVPVVVEAGEDVLRRSHTFAASRRSLRGRIRCLRGLGAVEPLVLASE